MSFLLHAACNCNTGRVRSNNEDNFFFDNISLREENNGLDTPLTMKFRTNKPKLVGVFDGMGGESHGEAASFSATVGAYAAARALPADGQDLTDYLTQACLNINQEVFNRAQSFGTTHMGATLAMLCFTDRGVYTCNLGDSRIFRLRTGLLQQISVDHTDEADLLRRGIKRKPRLTQHLGIDPEEMILEPHVACSELAKGDKYLICSDGLTDMLSEYEISKILDAHRDPAACSQALVAAALENGGRDNVTVIVLNVK